MHNIDREFGLPNISVHKSITSLLDLEGQNESLYYCNFSSSSSVDSFMVQILYLSLINNRHSCHLYFTATPLETSCFWSLSL